MGLSLPDLVEALGEMADALEGPSDPAERLVYLEFLRRKPIDLALFQFDPQTMSWPYLYGVATREIVAEGRSVAPTWRFLAVWAEVQILGSRAPLRHRELRNALEGGSEVALRAGLAAVTGAAERGDTDAASALVRLAVECPPDHKPALIEALRQGGVTAEMARDSLELYRGSSAFASRLRELEQLVFRPPTLEAPPPPPAPSSWTLGPRAKARTLEKPSVPWSFSGLARPFRVRPPGRLAVFSTATEALVPLLTIYEVGPEFVIGPSFKFSSYRPPAGSYLGGGDSRPFVSCQLCANQEAFVLNYPDGSADFLVGRGGEMLASLASGGPWECWARGEWLALSGSGGVYAFRVGVEPVRLCQEPVATLTFGAHGHLLSVTRSGLLRVFSDQGLLSENRLELPPEHDQLRLSPDGSCLACWDASGRIVLCDLASGTLSTSRTTGLANPQAAFSLDSDYMAVWDRETIQVWQRHGFPPRCFGPEALGLEPPAPQTRSYADETSLADLARYDRFFEGRQPPAWGSSSDPYRPKPAD